jgi:hypothetical protein
MLPGMYYRKWARLGRTWAPTLTFWLNLEFFLGEIKVKLGIGLNPKSRNRPKP